MAGGDPEIAVPVSSPTMAVRVEFEKIGKRFGARRVLANLSGILEPGKVVVVAGPNGAGKSTLLNILSGMMRPSTGRVSYRSDGHELARVRWFGLLGVSAPDMAVYEELTALENLRFFARLRGLQPGDDELSALLAETGLGRRDQRRFVGTYSSGMKQRVKLAQAVVHRPAVLLLDEPSSNLDATGHAMVARLVEAFRATAAVAVATNDPREMVWGDAQIELGR
jgi:heme exporter protein A